MRALCPQVKEPAPVLDFGCRGRDRPLSLPLLGRSETEWGETLSPNATATGQPQAPAPALGGSELTGALSCVWVRSSPRVSNTRWGGLPAPWPSLHVPGRGHPPPALVQARVSTLWPPGWGFAGSSCSPSPSSCHSRR